MSTPQQEADAAQAAAMKERLSNQAASMKKSAKASSLSPEESAIEEVKIMLDRMWPGRHIARQ